MGNRGHHPRYLLLSSKFLVSCTHYLTSLFSSSSNVWLIPSVWTVFSWAHRLVLGRPTILGRGCVALGLLFLVVSTQQNISSLHHEEVAFCVSVHKKWSPPSLPSSLLAENSPSGHLLPTVAVGRSPFFCLQITHPTLSSK